MSLQAVPRAQKHSEMGSGAQNQSLVASQKLRAFLEIPRNPYIVLHPLQAHLSRQVPGANKHIVTHQNLDSQEINLG